MFVHKGKILSFWLCGLNLCRNCFLPPHEHNLCWCVPQFIPSCMLCKVGHLIVFFISKEGFASNYVFFFCWLSLNMPCIFETICFLRKDCLVQQAACQLVGSQWIITNRQLTDRNISSILVRGLPIWKFIPSGTILWHKYENLDDSWLTSRNICIP